MINSEAVDVLAKEASLLKSWLIHFSTDYVFDGTKEGAYLETDATAPLGIYGQSKLSGEEAVRASGCRHLILRTSWVYAARGNNFIKTMLRLARERDELKVVCDQLGAPTSAELLADVAACCLYRLQYDASFSNEESATYHLAAGGTTELARLCPDDFGGSLSLWCRTSHNRPKCAGYPHLGVSATGETSGEFTACYRKDTKCFQPGITTLAASCEARSSRNRQQ